MNRTGYHPQGDQNGRRRPRKELFRYEYTPFDRYDVRPFDILMTRSKSLHAAAIVYFSGTDGESAWLSHSGQIMADGKTVSEANYPVHEYTPIDKYLELQERDKVRLTLIRLKPSIWPSREVREKAYDACGSYHRSIEGRRYDLVPGLLPMMMVSIIRNSIPFLKRGAWDHVPAAGQEAVFICSAIVDYGWAWAQRRLARDFFKSTLSLAVPSPQDIYDSEFTEFVAGWRKTYYQRR
jgi:hypothetical protein